MTAAESQDPVHVACPACHGLTRVPVARLGDGPRCPRCKSALFTGHPAELDAQAFEAHVARGSLPGAQLPPGPSGLIQSEGTVSSPFVRHRSPARRRERRSGRRTARSRSGIVFCRSSRVIQDAGYGAGPGRRGGPEPDQQGDVSA